MEILTEFDGLQEALSRVNMNESVMPYVNGVLVDDVVYNKVQKILNCPEMVSAHKYLLDLDLEHLDEEDKSKVEKLYKLGCDRGFIEDDLTDWDKELNNQDITEIVNDGKTTVVGTPGAMQQSTSDEGACWTVIYSATSTDGAMKTGEAYSDAATADAAKADAKSKLAGIGYSNISILAIEKCADKGCGCCCDTYNQSYNQPYANVNEDDDNEDASSDDGSSSSNDDIDDEVEEIVELNNDDDNDESGEDEGEKFEPPADEDDDEGSSDEDNDEESSEEGNDEKSSNEDGQNGESELSDAEKEDLKNEYRRIFKSLIGKYDTSFNKLTIDQKIEFLTKIGKKWKDKPEDFEFMTVKEIEQLNNVVVEDGTDDKDDEGDEGEKFEPPADEDDDEGSSDEGSSEEGNDEESSDEDEDEGKKFEPPTDEGNDEESSDEDNDED